MNKKFTKMIAAFALLAFLAAPMRGWAENVIVLEENFNDGTASGWTLSGKTSFQGSSGAKSLQIASGSGAGSAQTPAFSSLDGTFATMTFTAKSSGSADRTLTITGTNCKVEGATSTTITATSSLQTFTINITDASTTSKVTFSAASNQGTLIDDVLVYYTTGGGSTDPSITISGTGISNNAVSFDWNSYTNNVEYTASVAYNNMDAPAASDAMVGVYTDATCETSFSGDYFDADFGDDTETIEYAFYEDNPSDAPRTVYMRVETFNAEETEWVPCNVIAITQTGKPKYSVTYDGNGATSGTVPVDSNSPYFINSNVTVLGNTGGLVKTSHTFGGWCLDAAGTGTVYGPGDNQTHTFENISEDKTFYAKWIPNTNSYTLNVIGEAHLEESVEIFVPDQEGWNAGDDIQFGQQVTVSVVPSSGYTYSITVTDEDENNVPVEQDMFEMPDSDVTILVTVEELGLNATYTSNVTVGSDKIVISNVEYDAYKAGTSNAAGTWTVTVPANTNKLHLHLACWGTESVTLSVTPTGYSSNISLTPNSGISGNSPFTWGSGNNDKDPSSSFHYKVITFDGPLEEAVNLTFTASSGKRFVVWGVNAEMSSDPYITAADVDIASNATSGSIAYTIHNIPNPAGTLTAAVTTGGDWLSLGTVGTNVPFTCTANPNTVERTATVTLTYTYGDNETITETVTVTQAPLVVTYTYTLATSIENGKHYIITNGGTKIMGAQGSTNRTAVDVSDYYDSNDDEFSIPSNAGIYEFVINGPDADGYYTIHDAKPNTGYLYAAASGNNYLKTQGFNDDNGRWIIKFTDNGDSIVAQGNNTNKYMRYNYNNGNSIFSCYAKTSSVTALPYLYERNDSYYEFYKDIAKYTTPTGDDPVNGWNFIALPVAGSIAPDATMTSNTYDLYQLNDTKWENWRSTEDNGSHYHFNLVNGRGYLYANSANTTLHFSGAINTFTAEGNANQKDLTTGWNLIGNPYNVPIYINKAYYKMNAAGTAVESVSEYWSNTIPACTGVVVKATGDNEKVTFTTDAPAHSTGNKGNIQLALAQATRGNVSTLDNAIVSFNEGSELEKFYFMQQNANLYIPQGTEEYAIVSTEAQGEMPVNFRANENGTYTLTVNPEGVEMNYLHLIDNMTGMDIDLLANPSYSFSATTTDYESRFKLVFASNGASTGSATDETFAFYSDGNWIINNAGEATLQVVDLMGRILSSETVNGSVSKTINATTGIYMLRLINGENVKVQKVVVR